MAELCDTQRFLVAKGTDKWSFKLNKQLPKGSYKLYVRVTLTTGATQTTFDTSGGNLLAFSVT